MSRSRAALVLGAIAIFATGFDSAPPKDVGSLLALRNLSRKQVLEALTPARVDTNVQYQKLKPVDSISNADRWPGWFYFRGDKLAMIYVGSAAPAFYDWLDEKKIVAELGGPGQIVRSRVGRISNQHVYADRGFAYSEQNGKIDFVEIFAPMTHKQYLERVYEAAGPFVK